jgi:hypothetical protein
MISLCYVSTSNAEGYSLSYILQNYLRDNPLLRRKICHFSFRNKDSNFRIIKKRLIFKFLHVCNIQLATICEVKYKISVY